MIFKGFRFGMLLQIAVGPVSVFIFNLAMAQGLWQALSGVVGVVLGDAIFIALAIMGIGALIDRSPGAKRWMAYVGGVVLVLFGIKTGLDAVKANSVLTVTYHAFTTALILTVSSPLTIVFWGGVFSSRIVEDRLSRQQLYQFGFGAILSTALSQSLIAAGGTVFKHFMPMQLQMALNMAVGIALIVFGIRACAKQLRLDRIG
jgi:threonine/homoserine/homoserine lactone efflux protein